MKRRLNNMFLFLDIEKISFFGMDKTLAPTRCLKQTFDWVTDRRPFGRPRMRWKDNICATISKEDLV